MSSETDHPRQRTVAELLAEHGDAGATGRRRRRREADDPDEGAAAPEPVDGPAGATGSAAPAWRFVPPHEPDRPVPGEGPAPPQGFAPRQRVPYEPPPREAPVREPLSWESAPRELPTRAARPRTTGFRETGSPEPPYPEPPYPETAFREPLGPVRGPAPEPDVVPPTRDPDRVPAPAPRGVRPALEPARDRPTDWMPRLRDVRPIAPDPGLTGPIRHQRAEDDRAAAGADQDVADRTGDDEGATPDAGPPTTVGAAPAGAEDWHRARAVAERGARADRGPASQGAITPVLDDHPAGLGGDDPGVEDVDDDQGTGGRFAGARRLGRVAESAGQAWMAVFAQWIVGALGGAALWVAFRYLWRSLPVVALAAAVLVTVGLVVVVRALLRNDDTRTTVFAVLVGLLLTVSPAILVLLGR